MGVKGLSAANDNARKRRRNEQYGPWVDTQEWANRIGSRFFFTGKSCEKFHVSKRSTKDGRCCECEKERQQGSYWSHPEKKRIHGQLDHYKNRDRNLARMQAYANDYKNEIAIRRGKHREENRDKLIADSKLWHSENKEHVSLYRQVNAETYAAHARNRRARKRNAGGYHTHLDVLDILKRQNFRCVECGKSVRKRESRHVDHVMPIALGGSNWPSNLQVLCAPCNLSKNDTDPIVWAKRKGRLL